MLSKNLDYFFNISGKKINELARDLGVSEATTWNWRQNKIPSSNTLRRISRYFSETLSIPLELFQDGQALIERDLEKLLKEKKIEAQSLQSSGKTIGATHEIPKNSGENAPIREISEQEKDFLLSVRQLFNRRPDLETSPTDLNEALDLMKWVHPGSDQHHSMVRMLKGFRQYHEDMGRTSPNPEKDSDTDKK